MPLTPYQAESEQWMAILTGAGEKAFCAGNDLQFQAEHGPKAVQALRRDIAGGFGGLHRRHDCFWRSGSYSLVSD